MPGATRIRRTATQCSLAYLARVTQKSLRQAETDRTTLIIHEAKQAAEREPNGAKGALPSRPAPAPTVTTPNLLGANPRNVYAPPLPWPAADLGNPWDIN
jgi:hypothetical protein